MDCWHPGVGVRRFPANGVCTRDALSKDLKDHGFSFVGLTVIDAMWKPRNGKRLPSRLFSLG